MKVVMVINRYYPFVGGNETQCRLLAEELASRGVRVVVVTTWLWGTVLWENTNGVHICRVLPPLWSKLAWPTALLANICLFFFLVIKRKECDIIHCHQALWHALGTVVTAQVLGKKSVIKVSGSGGSGNVVFWRRRRILGPLAVALLRRADCVVALSREGLSELATLSIRDNVVVIPNGVRLTEDRESGPDLLRLEDIKNRSVKVATYVGRLSEEKGVGLLLTAWKEVRKKEPAAALLIVGDGPQKRALVRFAENNQFLDSVAFLGERKAVQSYLRQSDVFILPSKGEGMSNALLEAMSFGLPCIVSNVGGNLRLVKHGETGLLFEKEDPRDLAERVIEIFQDKDLASRLGDAAKDFIRKEFVMDVIAGKYLNLYQRLVAEN